MSMIKACDIIESQQQEIDRLNFSCKKHKDKRPEKVCYWCLRDVNFTYQMQVQEQREEIDRLTEENKKLKDYEQALKGESDERSRM